MSAVLELEGLTRRFGATTALDDLTFSVPDGALYGFVGRNGAGKTTTMRIVLGVLAPDAGEVRWRGARVGRDERRRFGYMPEERGLYPKMRVRDQLIHLARLHGYDAGRAGSASDALLERLGIADRAGDRTEQLSLGNQQRVQLAAALVHDPELLVLDEPFSGLDPVGVDVLSEVLLERVRGGTAVLFSSHQLELVERLCEGVAIVEGGRLVAAGPVDQLRRTRSGGDRWTVQLEGEAPEVLTGADSDAVLDAARRRGRVVRFSPAEPTLAELFRDVVEERAAA
jgi:ABC-2 type transport system ATP-binding protein